MECTDKNRYNSGLSKNEHLAHFFRGEAEHLVEIEDGGYIPTNVESAGKVVEGDRTYASEKYPLKRALELLEHVTVESLGMGQLVCFQIL